MKTQIKQTIATTGKFLGQFLTLILCPLWLNADQVLLKNGSVLFGTLIRAESEIVIFETPFAGNLSINRKNIQSMTTDQSVAVLLEDGTVLPECRIVSEKDQMQIQPAGEEEISLPSADLKMINPAGWMLGEGYEWSGAARFGLDLERGGTKKDEWHLEASSTWRNLKNRYIIEGEIENEQRDGNETENNWSALLKYDRFFKGNKENYRGIKGFFESDAMADLDLRMTIGSYLGRRFFENRYFTLQAELGPVYVEEDFKTTDEDWVGLSWNIQAESGILGHATKLFLTHDGNQNLDSPDVIFLNTRIGLSFPLVDNLEASIQIDYEYESTEAEDTLDTSYDWTIGYIW